MSEIEELLSKFKDGNASWADFESYMKVDDDNIHKFFNLASSLTRENLGNGLKIYIPNVKFPAISLTGIECALHCEHCNEKYLHGMKQILTNEDLENFLLNLHKNDGVGVLLSGGCDPDGSVPLLKFLDTVKKVKEKTGLIINAHTGLLNEETAKKLAEARVDIVSFDINMDEEIVRDIYHLETGLDEYKRAVDLLKQNNLNIVPHVCVGLYYGKLHKELNSLKFIKNSGINPSLIVLIALIPPKGKEDLFQRPKPLEIAKVAALIRFIFPKTEISLGCMRPRGNIKVEMEKLAIKAGITRIEIPSPTTIKWLKEENPEISLKYFSACCAIPEDHEESAISKESDIKRYLDI